MRPATTAEQGRHRHDALCYSSDDELLAVAVPFLLSGVAAGEPTVVSLSERTTGLIRAQLPAGSGVSFLAGGDMYARPSGAIRSYRKLLASCMADGARRIRIIGELPRADFDTTWDWWARYESAVNYAYDDFPLWSMCAYDTRTTPAPVLDDVARTHPRVALAGGGHTPSRTYTDPHVYLTENRPATVDPLQRSRPIIDLVGPTPAQARRAVYDVDRGGLPTRQLEDLVIAVSETVTNALLHGRHPVRARFWAGDDRVVVTVNDGGDGPKDPFAGLMPAADRVEGGLGLWLTHQSCSHVSMHRGPDGFTVRLTAGNPRFWSEPR